MSLLDTLRSLFSQPARRFKYVHIPPERASSYRGTRGAALPEETYIRLWLSDSYIKEGNIFGTNVYPSAYSNVTLTSVEGAQKSIPNITGVNPEQLKTRGVFKAFTLTGLMPYRGETIKIESYLTIATGKDLFGETLKILEQLNDAAQGPATSALQAAGILKSGITTLLGAVDGQVRLGYAEEFTRQRLMPGYIAVIRLPEGGTPIEFEDERFSVVQDRLHYRYAQLSDARPSLFDSADYLLLQIEFQKEHDNWEAISTIKKPLDDACRAFLNDESQKGVELRKMTGIAILDSEFLTRADKRRVKAAAASYLDNDCTLLGGVRRGMEVPEAEGAKSLGVADEEAEPTRRSMQHGGGSDEFDEFLNL